MHKKPTYEEMIRLSMDPNDKIALPDRMATQLRNTPQLTKFDDDTHLNLSDEQNKISRERIREIEIRNVANTNTNNYYNTTNVAKANEEDTTTLPGAPPPAPPPPAAKAQMNMAGTQTGIKQTQSRSTSTGSGDPYFAGHQAPPPQPPPPGAGGAATPFFNTEDLLRRQYQEHLDSLQHIENMSRMREQQRAYFVQQHAAQAMHRNPGVAEQMADFAMGGGGPPQPPPGGAGIQISMATGGGGPPGPGGPGTVDVSMGTGGGRPPPSGGAGYVSTQVNNIK